MARSTGRSASVSVAPGRYGVRVVSDPLVPKTLLRLRRADAAAARRAERALDELLSDGGLADLTQHDLQTYLWFTLGEAPEPHETAAPPGGCFRARGAER